MYNRYASERVVTALQDTPVVLIVGPRQCGKTTLVKQMTQSEEWNYVTLDDVNQLKFAKEDPIGFIRTFAEKKRLVIDEIQRAQELFLPIKQWVDEHRAPGSFLLTGSANAMALPQVADSLAGRLELVSLMPLAECEIRNTPSTFLSKILAGEIPESREIRVREQLISKVTTGGFPEAIQRKTETRRIAWFDQYILSIIQKDMRDISQIEHINVMTKLIQMMANQTGSLINYTAVSDDLGLARQTVVKYFYLLQQLFIYQELPAWHKNDNKRLIKTPKAHLVDSGLLCGLKRIHPEKIKHDPQLFGMILENYVVCELRRLASWHDEPLYFSHYRDKDKVEVDIVLETLSGKVYGIEVKASATIGKKDFQGLERLKEAAGAHFALGLLLYDGDYVNKFSENIYSIPIGSLWI